MQPRLVLATRNAHKADEIRGVLGQGFHYQTLAEFPAAPAVVEDAPTFRGNAKKKAEILAAWLAHHGGPGAPEGGFVLADDSGLEVDALNGAPGVHSARFAADEAATAGNAPDAANNAKLLRLLANVPAAARTARFRCVIALAPIPERASPADPAPESVIFEGVCEGLILARPRGTAGFGYDPLFQPLGYDQTFAELGAEIKNRISHRARALEALRAWFERWSPAGG